MQIENDPAAGRPGAAILTEAGPASPVGRRRFVAGVAGLAAVALLGGCAADGDRKYCYGTARIGVKGRRITPVPCPEE